jgi:hypothetical protein
MCEAKEVLMQSAEPGYNEADPQIPQFIFPADPGYTAINCGQFFAEVIVFVLFTDGLQE